MTRPPAPGGWNLIASLVYVGALSGCMLGPNYKGPPAVTHPAAFQRATATMDSAEPAARWWISLGDRELDRLIDSALASSPTVESATARLRQARAQLLGQRATGLPNSGVSGAYVRTRNLTSLLGSGNAGSGASSGALNLYAIGFDATWEIDVFGGNARAVQAAAATVGASQANLAAVRVSLSAEVGQAYVQLRDAQQRLVLTQRNIDVERRLLHLYALRRAGGTASELDVARLTNQLDTTRATLPPLRAEVAEQLDRIAVLTGGVPGSLDAELAAPASAPPPPSRVTIGDPGALLQRRPDIVVAERTLAARTASVGQSIAASFPKVSLLGEVGFASLTPQALLDSSNFSYALAPILQWTPLDFGRNRARIGAARAAREQAQADYRSTVLSALEDAEDSLARYAEQRNSVIDLARAQASAEQVYTLTEIRLHGGTADTTDVLDADTRRIQAELAYQQGLAELTRDYISLQKSLGLGWVDASNE
ncbi:MAG TPA: efflux transporter outer membrane subunit [Steroidobacteraceae bacterium]|nr:efflux transporter outer membrane subunit [Steroidobacteraceae bacterium]